MAQIRIALDGSFTSLSAVDPSKVVRMGLVELKLLQQDLAYAKSYAKLVAIKEKAKTPEAKKTAGAVAKHYSTQYKPRLTNSRKSFNVEIVTAAIKAKKEQIAAAREAIKNKPAKVLTAPSGKVHKSKITPYVPHPKLTQHGKDDHLADMRDDLRIYSAKLKKATDPTKIAGLKSDIRKIKKNMATLEAHKAKRVKVKPTVSPYD
jgi:hypothetical protein